MSITVNVHSKAIQTIDYEDLAGQTFTGNNVFFGESDATAGIGDPTVFFLSYAYRGKTYKIDTSRYHNLVAKMGIAGIHSTNDGSIARVMYMREDEHSIGGERQPGHHRPPHRASGRQVGHAEDRGRSADASA